MDEFALMGEYLKAAEKSEGGRPVKTGAQAEPVSRPPTLAEVGISKKESSQGQAVAHLTTVQKLLTARGLSGSR